MSGVGRGYNRFAVAEKRLSLWNEAARPFMRYAARTNTGRSLLGAAARRFTPADNLLEIVFEPAAKTPVGRITLYLSRLSPRLSDLSLVLYVSAQSSRKRPSQATGIARALYREARRLRGEAITALLAPRGATRGAYSWLRGAKILVARTGSELLGLVRRFLEKRWQSLLAALRGKRVYGPLALLLLALSELLEILGGAADRVLAHRLLDSLVTGEAVEIGGPRGPP